ncbi:CHAT domain-containing protein [Irpex rosettiformis]|uniref:CHAT domain-containing protein n=1 Tax=Irpex rosettiformis TaxID=378272 RepID=A0ACB8TPL8_9APHY|nr:CHAT domain-containing protein [Irpex rosettiformis]
MSEDIEGSSLPEDLSRIDLRLDSDVGLMEPSQDTRGESGKALYKRYMEHGDIEDLERCVAIWREEVQSARNDDAETAYALHNLALTLQARFEHYGQPNDLEEAIASCQCVLKLTPDDDVDMSSTLNNLGNALRTRFQSSGSSVDLQDAIMHLTRATELTPEGSPDMPMMLNSLGIALWTRSKSSGSSVDLQDAIVHYTRAIELTPEGSPAMATQLNNLGSALQARYESSGSSVDLQDAIMRYTRAIELTPKGNPDMASRLNNLGNALWTQYKSLGSSVDLQGAIMHFTHAIELTPEGSPYMPMWLNNLGNALQSLYGSSGSSVDLQDAIVHFTHAIELTLEGSPDMPMWLNNLGSALWTRSQFSGSSVDLQDAIVHFTHAIELTPEGSSYMPMWLHNLGSALQTRYQSSGSSVDLQDAILHFTHAIELTPESSPTMASQLNSLGNALCTQYKSSGSSARYESSGSSVDLQDAIVHYTHAIELIPESHPWRVCYFYHLGTLYFLSMESGYKEADNAIQAMQAFAGAMEQASGDPYWSVQAGLKYIELLSMTPSISTPPPLTKLDAHRQILNLIPRVIWLGYDLQKQYKKLASLKMPVSHAVSDAITAGEYQQALEWLECSRAIVWAQVLQLRTPLDDLAQHHPQLASRLQAISAALQKDASESSSNISTSSKGHFYARRKDTYDFALEYNCIIEEIRSLEGFKNFLQPKRALQLMAACTSSPVIIINVHRSRCDALVLIHNEDIIHIPLPLFSYDHAGKLHTQLWSFVRRRPKARNDMHDSDRNDLTERFLTTATGGDTQLDEEVEMRAILHDLWAQIVRPIIDALKYKGLFKSGPDGDLPHITWCPTGPLVFLPLHAAGIYPPHGISETIMDIAVSSYTPTLDVLLQPQARRDNDGNHTNYPKLLVVHQPNVPGYAPIPHTIDEAEEIHKAFRSHANIVDEPNGTVEAVLEGMRTHDWVHLACHGMQDIENRLNSAFALSDGKLTLSRLMSEHILSAELAVLSACQTAMGDDELPEEAIHLAARMLNIGYRSVIGTMWSIYDESAPIVMKPFYHTMAKQVAKGGELQPAYALHEATRVLRKKVGEKNFMQWVPYIHLGL